MKKSILIILTISSLSQPIFAKEMKIDNFIVGMQSKMNSYINKINNNNFTQKLSILFNDKGGNFIYEFTEGVKQCTNSHSKNCVILHSTLKQIKNNNLGGELNKNLTSLKSIIKRLNSKNGEH